MSATEPAHFELGRELTGDGCFVRQESKFRRWVTADGSSGFPAEPGRYHLYACLACPWSQRVTIGRILKGLEDAISISYTDPTATRSAGRSRAPSTPIRSTASR